MMFFIEDACGDHTAAPLGLHFAAIHVADWRGEGGIIIAVTILKL